SLVHSLLRDDALCYACALDVSREPPATWNIKRRVSAKVQQKHLTAEHNSAVVQSIWKLRHALERMPIQLYIQCVLMSELVANAVELATLYFAQRRPRELAKFDWTVETLCAC